MVSNEVVSQEHFTLLTGAIVEVDVNNLLEACKAMDHLLDVIIQEHYEELLNLGMKNGDCRVMEIIDAEIQYLFGNMLRQDPKGKDPKGILRWVLSSLASSRLVYIRIRPLTSRCLVDLIDHWMFNLNQITWTPILCRLFRFLDI